MIAKIINEKNHQIDVHPEVYRKHEVGEMTVYYAKSFFPDISFATVVTAAGSYFDPPGKGGLAHLSEHMIFTGTEKYTEDDINNIGLECGADLNAYTSKDKICVYGSPLTRKFEEFLDLLVDLSCHANPNSEVFEREHSVVQQERKDGESDLISVAGNNVFEKLFMDSPFNHPVIGREDTIDNCTFQDVKEFLETMFVPERQFMVIRSALEWSEIEKILAKYFHREPKEKLVFTDISSPLTLRGKDVEDTSEFGTVALAYVIPVPLKIPEDGVFCAINGLVGCCGMNSILWKKLRQEKGLVYGVSSTYRTFMGTPDTLFSVSATFSDASRIEEVKEDIRNALKDSSLYLKETLEQHFLNLESDIASQPLSEEGGAWRVSSHLLIGETIDFHAWYNRFTSVTISDVREAVANLNLWKGNFYTIKPEN